MRSSLHYVCRRCGAVCQENFINLLKSLENRTADFVPMIEAFGLAWRRRLLRSINGTCCASTVVSLRSHCAPLCVIIRFTPGSFACRLLREVEQVILAPCWNTQSIDGTALGAHYTREPMSNASCRRLLILRWGWGRRQSRERGFSMGKANKKAAAAEVPEISSYLVCMEVRDSGPCMWVGNFLYVCSEHLKRKQEGEILNAP